MTEDLGVSKTFSVFNDKVRAIKKYCNENETSRFITNTLTKWDEAKKHMTQCEKEYAEFKKEISSGTHDYKMVTKKINNQQKAIFNARKNFAYSSNKNTYCSYYYTNYCRYDIIVLSIYYLQGR